MALFERPFVAGAEIFLQAYGDNVTDFDVERFSTINVRQGNHGQGVSLFPRPVIGRHTHKGYKKKAHQQQRGSEQAAPQTPELGEGYQRPTPLAFPSAR
jgi:hypothetical protein